MPSTKSHPVYRDLYGLAYLLSAEQLFRFLKVKKCIPEDAIYEDYKDNLQEYIHDMSEYRYE